MSVMFGTVAHWTGASRWSPQTEGDRRHAVQNCQVQPVPRQAGRLSLGWRLISRHDGTNYLEETLYHHAGLDGYGGASDVDSVVMRRTFLTTGSPQTEDERWYVLQNWRQDPVVTIDESAVQRERAHFSPYGRIFGMVAGDTDFDGDYGAGDDSAITGWSTAYQALADVDLDGDVDATDASFTTNVSMGWDVLSRDGSTVGYAGSLSSKHISTLGFSGAGVYHADLGRLIQRPGSTDGYGIGPSQGTSLQPCYGPCCSVASDSRPDSCGSGGADPLWDCVEDAPDRAACYACCEEHIPDDLPEARESCKRHCILVKKEPDWEECKKASEDTLCEIRCKDRDGGALGLKFCEGSVWRCCICDDEKTMPKDSKWKKPWGGILQDCIKEHEMCHVRQGCPRKPLSEDCIEWPCYLREANCYRDTIDRCNREFEGDPIAIAQCRGHMRETEDEARREYEHRLENCRKEAHD